MILVVILTQHQNALWRVFHSKQVEIQQHHLARHVCETAHLTMIVRQLHFDDSRLHDSGLVNALGLTLGFDDAGILQTLNGNVVQVLTTQGSRIKRVPAGGNGSKHLAVIAAVLRVEDKPRPQCLEQSEVGIALERLLEDIVALHIFLIGIDHTLQRVTQCNHRQAAAALQSDGASLQVNLLQSQFLDFQVVVRTADVVFSSHLGISRLDGVESMATLIIWSLMRRR